jgi:hypothetical protein
MLPGTSNSSGSASNLPSGTVVEARCKVISGADIGPVGNIPHKSSASEMTKEFL